MVAHSGVRTGRLSLKSSYENENSGLSYTATAVIEAASTGMSLRLTSNNIQDSLGATVYYVVVGKELLATGIPPSVSGAIGAESKRRCEYGCKPSSGAGVRTENRRVVCVAECKWERYHKGLL